MRPVEIIKEARTYAPDTNDSFPVTEATLYARINARQRQLFALASSWNQEYYGRSVLSSLSNGCVDLDKLEDTKLWPIETVDRVEIADPGDSEWRKNTVVTICRADEQREHLPPRMLLRSHTLQAVDDLATDEDGETRTTSDLEGVSKVRIWYSRRPRTIDGRGDVQSRTEDVEIGDPWEWLLVWDLVKSLTKRVAQTDTQKDAPVVLMARESEVELLNLFRSHVTQYARSTEHIGE